MATEPASAKQQGKDHRKALVREYKRTPKAMGVYCIHHLASDKRFVAATRDLTARFNRHRLELKMNSERVSASLQKDWNTFGADAFEFTVLEALEPLDEPAYDPGDDLEALEEIWLEKLQPYEPAGYNAAT